MKALIIKDLLLIKSNIKGLIFIIIAFGFIIANDMSNITYLLPLICMTMCTSTFSYDEYYKWDLYAISFPNKKEDIVKSKYIMTIILITIATLIMALVAFISKKPQLYDSLLGSTVGILIIISIMYPLLYKYGMEKGKIIFFGLIILMGVALGYIVEIANISIPNIGDNLLLIAIVVITLIVLFISYTISKKIYLKKEL